MSERQTKSFSEELEDCIKEGGWITYLRSGLKEKELEDIDMPEYGVSVVSGRMHTRYMRWKIGVQELLEKNGYKDEAEVFWEADTIPLVLLDNDYLNAESSKTKQLLNDIQAEAKKKLAILRLIRGGLKPKVKLAEHKVSFDKAGIIKIGDYACKLPKESRRFYFAKEAFKYKPNVSIDWSKIAEKLYQKDLLELKPQDKKSIQDFMYAVNDDIKDQINTEDSLFSWDNGTVTRGY